MELKDTLRERHSIRKYKEKLPSKEVLDELIATASLTPSPTNTQPVRVFALTSDDSRQKLKEALERGCQNLLERGEELGNPDKILKKIKFYWRYSGFIFEAPIILAIGTVKNVNSFAKKLSESGVKEEDDYGELGYNITLGSALQNLSLKAVELKLGSCILTAPLNFLDSKFEDLYDLKDVSIKALVTLGYPDEEPKVLSKNKLADFFQEL